METFITVVTESCHGSLSLYRLSYALYSATNARGIFTKTWQLSSASGYFFMICQNVSKKFSSLKVCHGHVFCSSLDCDCRTTPLLRSATDSTQPRSLRLTLVTLRDTYWGMNRGRLSSLPWLDLNQKSFMENLLHCIEVSTIFFLQDCQYVVWCCDPRGLHYRHGALVLSTAQLVVLVASAAERLRSWSLGNSFSSSRVPSQCSSGIL